MTALNFVESVVALLFLPPLGYVYLFSIAESTTLRELPSINRDKWLGKTDPSSFSNPDVIVVEYVRTESVILDWTVDFSKTIFYGSVVHELVVLNANAKEVIFDSRGLHVTKVVDVRNGKQLPFSIGETVSSFGEPLTIPISEKVQASEYFRNVSLGTKLTIKIEYSTSENSTALQWLNPLQTAGKRHPYVFSQSEPIHGRSLFPCQDTPSVKAPYTATVSVSKELQALMGAVFVGRPEPDTTNPRNKIYRFEQKIRIPSYLIAVAVGDIVGKDIGPRSRVWAEKELVDQAAFEFSETENMLKVAENLLGKYVWGRYDILVLPPSFAYGGMENPCLIFTTPILLAGDKSLASVITHEITHSWTGNLVTNKNWEHFWLNEGFATYLEQRIMGILQGEEYRQFASIRGWNRLKEVIASMKDDVSLTKLINDLNGVDPEDAFTRAPYEKGYAFLYYLEDQVGGPTEFNPFLVNYIQENSYQSIDTEVFKSTFISYFHEKGLGDRIINIDWDSWLYTTGMPPVDLEFHYDQTLRKACTNLKNRWIEWNDSSNDVPFKKSDLAGFFPAQIMEFLQELLQEEPLSFRKIEAMENIYEMNSRKNTEIRSRWIRLCIRARATDVFPIANLWRPLRVGGSEINDHSKLP